MKMYDRGCCNIHASEDFKFVQKVFIAILVIILPFCYADTTNVDSLPAAIPGESMTSEPVSSSVNTVVDDTADAKALSTDTEFDTIGVKVSDTAKVDLIPTSPSKTDEALSPSDTTFPVLPESELTDTAKADSIPKAKIKEKIPVEEEEISIRGGPSPDYRSPRKAMFYSLLIPGLGQYYARAKVKAVAFVLIEAACFGVRYYFNDKGKEKDMEFRDSVEAHYSDSAYTEWHDWAKRNIDSNTAGIWDDYLYHDEFYKESEEARDQQFYEMVTKYIVFVHGWDDVEPTLIELQNDQVPDSIDGKPAHQLSDKCWVVIGDDTTFGFSQHQCDVAKISASSNNYYRKADNVWFAVMVNHICSGIDAALTARRHNRALLGHKRAFLDRLHIKGQTIAGAYGPVPGAMIRIDF